MHAAGVDKIEAYIRWKDEEKYMTETCTIIFLALNGWKDWKEKEISLKITLLYGLTGVFYSIWRGRTFMDVMIPGGISLLFFVLSIWTKEKIGLGDGLVLLALAGMLDTERYVQMLWMGLFMAAGYSGILLIRRKSRKTEIPFIPFLFLGYAGGLII